MPQTTTIDQLPAPLGTEAVVAGDDAIRALTAKLDGKLHTPGDVKYGFQAADHGLWFIADGRNNIVRVNVNQAFIDLMLALGFPGYDGAHIGVPDVKGRMLIAVGTNPDVNAVNKNDGLAVAARTPKHKTSVNDPGHIHNVTDPQHAHPSGIFVSDDSSAHDGNTAATASPFSRFLSTGVMSNAAAGTGISIQSHATGITGGPQDAAQRPVDTIPFLTANCFIFGGAP